MDESFLNDLLECSVCLEQLDSTSKVLPCQHTFCKRCLQDIVNTRKELRCPECRVLVETKVEDLPANILLIRLLEGIKNSSQLKSSIASAKKPVSASSTSTTGTTTTTNQYSSPPRSLQTHNVRQSMPLTSVEKSVVKQPSRSHPCAKALYTYEGKEPGDLSFKKGDTIILQRKINQNWYHGELNGKYGFVPSRYVRMIVPILPHVPQCKALYDFTMGDNDEKDCLTFKKGEVITVIRRIDDNWAEGKLFDRIGIFPISFVEMNVAARSLLKLSMNTQPGPSRVAPPTPATNSLHVVAPANTKSNTRGSSQAPDDSSPTTTPSPGSSTTPSPSSPPSSSNSSSSLHHALPVSSVENTEKPDRILTRSASQRSSHHREKRHSLSSLSVSPVQKSPQMSVAHEHSTEILSTAGGDILAAPNRGLPIASQGFSLSTSCSNTTTTTTTTKSPKCDGESQAAVCPTTGSTENAHHGTGLSPRTITQNVRNVPAVTGSQMPASATSSPSAASASSSVPPVICMALYNYRPKKEDELLLKKGDYYTVTEKCQDGWFKGTSVRTGETGVFPGNYVQISKSAHQPQLQQQSLAALSARSGGLKSMLPVVVAPPRQKSLLHSSHPGESFSVSNEKSGHAAVTNISATKRASQEARSSVTSELLEWARHVSAVTSSSASMPTNAPSSNPFATHQEFTKESGNADVSPWFSNVTAAVSQGTATNTSSSAPYMSGSCQAQPDAKNLPCETPKRNQVWHGGRSRPSSSLHAAPPSMSIVSPPNVSLRAPNFGHPAHVKSEKHKMRKDKARESLMKRITGRKKTRLAVSNFCDNPSFVESTVSAGETVHASGVSGNSELATGQMLGQSGSKAGDKEVAVETSVPSSHLKQPQSGWERFRCVVPYPPNSEYELELKVGDIVHVHKKREDGWYKGTLLRTGKTGLFPASFVDRF